MAILKDGLPPFKAHYRRSSYTVHPPVKLRNTSMFLGLCLFFYRASSGNFTPGQTSTKKQSHLGHGILFINQETKPLGSWRTVHRPRNKATWVMAYCTSTKKQSHLGHGILFINQETKPLGSWHIVY